MSKALAQPDLKTLEFHRFDVDSDIFRVCQIALSFVGQPYLQAEELASGAIDCSTLTSQSHWLGAQVGIPFVADSQRVAASGHVITDVMESVPGDIWIRYASARESPDGQFNHVGIYLGIDDNGDGWVIESRGGVGVILTQSDQFPPLGGIKRYLNFGATPFNGLGAESARLLAEKVPKMGRLGARQYAHGSEIRYAHKGVDIYLPFGTEIISPITGSITPYSDQIEGAGCEIIDNSFFVRILHVCLSGKSSDIVAGQKLGSLVEPNEELLVYVDGLTKGNCHIHIEVGSEKNELFGVSSHMKIDGVYYFNYIELLKMGRLDPIV
jgi:hypothetical protein